MASSIVAGRLLKLPAECLAHILAFVLYDTKGLRVSLGRVYSRIDVDILFCCKMLRRDGLAMLFGCNAVRFPTSRDFKSFCLRMRTPLLYIRHVVLGTISSLDRDTARQLLEFRSLSRLTLVSRPRYLGSRRGHHAIRSGGGVDAALQGQPLYGLRSLVAQKPSLRINVVIEAKLGLGFDVDTMATWHLCQHPRFDPSGMIWHQLIFDVAVRGAEIRINFEGSHGALSSDGLRYW